MSDPVPVEQQFYSSVKAAALFGVSAETIGNWCKNGTLIGAIKINGFWRIPRASVIALANSKYGTPSNPTTGEPT